MKREMKYLEAVEVVKKVGGGDLLEGMNVIKDMQEPPRPHWYDANAVRAYHIVWLGMNKLFG